MTAQRRWFWPTLMIGLSLVIASPLIALLSQTLVGVNPAFIVRQLLRPSVVISIQHSLLLGLGTVIGTTLIATPLAYLMTHTTFGTKNWLQWLLVVPFMTPPYINAMGWLYFFQPHGLLAQLLPSSATTFTWLFSPVGMILIMSLHLYPIAYLLLKTTLQQFNQRWIQAARIHGVGYWRILVRIMLPVLLVPYLAVWLLVFTKTLAEFGTPATFGRAIQFNVLTTSIQNDLSQWPLNFQEGILLGSVLLGIALLAWLVQQCLMQQRSVPLSNQAATLVPIPWPLLLLASIFLIGLLSLAIGIPYSAIIMQSLMKQRSVGIGANNFTLVHYLALLKINGPAFQALMTTFGLGILISGITVILGTLISFGSTHAKTTSRWRRALQLLGAFPLAIPNVVLALSLIVIFSKWLAFTQLSGTIGLLVIADCVLFLPTTVQYMTTAFKAFNVALVSSAQVFESNPIRIFRKIVWPLLLPALLNSFAMTFIATSRELVMALLLLPSGVTTNAAFIYQAFEQGDASQGMALAVITVLITFGILLASNQTIQRQLKMAN